MEFGEIINSIGDAVSQLKTGTGYTGFFVFHFSIFFFFFGMVNTVTSIYSGCSNLISNSCKITRRSIYQFITGCELKGGGGRRGY